MPWYIRFGKVPEVTTNTPARKGFSPLELSFSFEIRNDLGDALYPGPSTISIRVTHSNKSLNPILAQSHWDGQKWMQNIKLQLPLFFTPGRPGDQAEIQVHLDHEPDGDSNNTLAVDQCDDLRYIYSTTSAPFPLVPGTKAEPRALRRLPGGLEVWEGTGSSIAAHVWDAGIVLCAHLCYLARTRDSEAHELATVLLAHANKKQKALELGAGCGISGLVLTQQLSNFSVELTDIQGAQELLARNVHATTSTTGPLQSRSFYVLDWESAADRDAAAQRVKHRDLILVSDCTYNVDMIEHLVRALRAVANSAETLVAVAMKRRHKDEEKFFLEMRAAGFEGVGVHVFGIPASEVEEGFGVQPGEVELHLYRWRER